MKQVKIRKPMVKFFIFSFLFITIIFAVIFVYAIYRYYHNVQNRQDEISSDYSQHMAEQAKRKEEQITNAPDHYIQISLTTINLIHLKKPILQKKILMANTNLNFLIVSYKPRISKYLSALPTILVIPITKIKMFQIIIQSLFM